MTLGTLALGAELDTSHDGTCGNGVSCAGSMFGGCCSASGQCGSTPDYCGLGCQSEFGYCQETQGNTSPDGLCSGREGYTCCQPGFGKCSSKLAARSNVLISASASATQLDKRHDPTSTAPSASNAASYTSCPAANNTIFSTECGAECVPCEGQSGQLPYCGADVHTDNYKFTPKTCRTVRYEIDITNTTIAPDGRPRQALLINGQMPGPPIEANWGDTVIVKVNNKMQDNGTSIHFHGIRQYNTTEADGVVSVTQCPIAPGESMTYEFVATNYGTSWYHSHYGIQAWEGVQGPLIIHGPTSKEYDVDAGTIMLNDWSLRTVDSMFDEAQDAINGGPRRMDNGLINGKNTWGADGTANQTGARYEVPTKFEPGKSYLFRIINGAIQSTYKFYIDNHTLEVINMDFTAIQPYQTNILNINIGQRYMVIVRANQIVGDYWMRADNQNMCAATIQAMDIKAIVRYSGSSGGTPTSPAYKYMGECVDEPLASLIPKSRLKATNQDLDFTYDITVRNNGANMFRWYLSGTTFYATYDNPTLQSVVNNATIPTTSGNLILDIPKLHDWVYIVIQSAIPLPHPIHLHGHDFFILAAGRGKYTSGSTLLNLNNPPRRDTVNMPGAGFVVIAFETDNPGTWLMHCHIGWHAAMGFALQIVEAKDSIDGIVKDQCMIDDVCRGWKSYVARTGFQQHDSGI
ncbi:Cupredoxin [Dendryphion nanum]|uniref:Cupredoxin n=1 Tax=Dendryphion nanum TaxID=256645 RepID=A0A9P9EE14_9PLEO|nr:Cupredoxin [Dendryphion nanum]